MSTGDIVGQDRGERLVSTGRCPVGSCGNHTYVLEDQYDLLRDKGHTFYCPAGHQQSFTPRKKANEDEERRKRLEREARNARERAELAERTCPWPTCEGRVLASPKGLRQHMVKAHGAPWATAEVTRDEIVQVLNGRDPGEVVR
jgi:hypothetical protein